MKYSRILSFTIGLLCILQAYQQATACSLEQAIDLPETNLHQIIYPFSISEAKFDKKPIFNDAQAYNPETDSLTLDFFNLDWENRELNIMGASINEVNSTSDWPENIGFSPSYIGSYPNFEKGYANENGLETFSTKYAFKLEGERHRGDRAEYVLIAKVKNKKLVSVEFKLPIFEVYSRENHTTLLAFTGEHQTLCLKSGIIQ